MTVYKEMTYPKCSKLRDDIIHSLPDILAIPPIQKELFASNKYHIIYLTGNEAKNVSEGHLEIKKYLESNSSIYNCTMIAFKRSLHICLVSFSTKILIYVLSIKATLTKYNKVFEKTEIGGLFERCFTILRTGFHPASLHTRNILVLEEESNFVFGEFIHERTDHIPLAYLCCYIAQQLIIFYYSLINTIFIPMCTILYNEFGEPPMHLFKMVNMQQIQAKPNFNFNSTINDMVTLIKNEYNFMHQLQTRDNPTLYYLLMVQLGFVKHLELFDQNEILKYLDKEKKKYIGKTLDKVEEDADYLNNLICSHEKEKGMSFKTVFNLKSTDENALIYSEMFGTEVQILSLLLYPINVFASKFTIVNALLESERYSSGEILSRINKSDSLFGLVKTPHNFDEMSALVINGGMKQFFPITSQPMLNALDIFHKPSFGKIKSIEQLETTAIQKAPKRSLSLTNNDNKEMGKNFDARLLDRKNFSNELLSTIYFDHEQKIIPTIPLSNISINPIIYWPLFRKEDEMVNKQGEPYNIFDFPKNQEETLSTNINLQEEKEMNDEMKHFFLFKKRRNDIPPD
ncbi:hypothetical protein SNEBB_002460 [Seison nebaliae]|nr:hypothetical protein SNEBB_002460 [Seison nebaliae]